MLNRPANSSNLFVLETRLFGGLPTHWLLNQWLRTVSVTDLRFLLAPGPVLKSILDTLPALTLPQNGIAQWLIRVLKK
jgi:hypothetical protein